MIETQDFYKGISVFDAAPWEELTSPLQDLEDPRTLAAKLFVADIFPQEDGNNFSALMINGNTYEWVLDYIHRTAYSQPKNPLSGVCFVFENKDQQVTRYLSLRTVQNSTGTALDFVDKDNCIIDGRQLGNDFAEKAPIEGGNMGIFMISRV